MQAARLPVSQGSEHSWSCGDEARVEAGWGPVFPASCALPKLEPALLALDATCCLWGRYMVVTEAWPWSLLWEAPAAVHTGCLLQSLQPVPVRALQHHQDPPFSHRGDSQCVA